MSARTPSRAFFALIRVVRSIPLLHAAIWKVRQSYHAMERARLVGKRIVDGNSRLREAVERGAPLAAGKIGSVEASALQHAMQRESARAAGRSAPAYPPYMTHALHVNAGVFPANEAVYDRFAARFLADLTHCDLLMAWDIAGEAQIMSRHARQATLVDVLEPFFRRPPWTAGLAGRRVLVISPFADSIRRQFAVRETLWDDPDMLPAFTLETVQAPLSAGLVAPRDADWFAALERMQREMDGLVYDVALIGAGAYSIPLAVHARNTGRIGIHLGGSLQVLFGVVGKRFEKKSKFHPLIKPTWVRPSASETPLNARQVEDGCYW